MVENKRETVGNLNVKVDVEVSEAIKGLKAVQRAAKDATKALAELRSESKEFEKEMQTKEPITISGESGGYGTVPLVRYSRK
ncbi:hypothetical protein [Bacillus altitudinis]|uniref:hypothetical protein n=1 Tax=Bacillus altitudinis TaxID=293387 RepID=UPI002100BFD0|nr:hypothetical protein [Bacillus altitudinis]UTV31965.1 hypothetical protein NM966_14435 [Bacillus altitudinis]